MGWNRGVGHLGFQPTLWPKPAELLDDVRRQHFAFITHEYPVLHEQSPLFAEAEARGYLLATGYERGAGGVANYRQGQRHLDFSNPHVCAWWWAAPRGRWGSAPGVCGGSRGGGAPRPPRSSPAATARACTTSTIGSATRP